MGCTVQLSHRVLLVITRKINQSYGVEHSLCAVRIVAYDILHSESRHVHTLGQIGPSATYMTTHMVRIHLFSPPALQRPTRWAVLLVMHSAGFGERRGAGGGMAICHISIGFSV